VNSSIIKPLILALLLWPLAPGPVYATEPQLVHVVLIWLKEPGNAAHRAQIIDATRKFSNMEGVREIRAGTPVSSERSTVDDSFDIGLYMTFSSKEALEAYLNHPEHEAAQRSVLRPLVKKVLAYDFWDDGK
jgi:heme-degrading monooxygenase HmoA